MPDKGKTKPKDATSYRETAFGILPRQELIVKEAEGIAKGLEYILGLSRKTRLQPSLLLKLHNICFGWIFPKWAGRYRTIDVETSTHQFPPYYEVPELTKRFFDDLNERLKHPHDPVELIAWAQHRIVWIHPFQDYNGRMARLFSNLLMARFGLPIVEIKIESERQRRSYINAIKAADVENYKKLVRMIRSAVDEVKQ